jgi:hypothetical protein
MCSSNGKSSSKHLKAIEIINKLSKQIFGITEQEMNEFLNSDDENSLAFMEDVNDLINSDNVENANFESSNYETEAVQVNDN